MTLLLGGALRFTKYDYFQEQFVKFVVMKGEDPGPGAGSRIHRLERARRLHRPVPRNGRLGIG
jgi:hypothetical protein